MINWPKGMAMPATSPPIGRVDPQTVPSGEGNMMRTPVELRNKLKGATAASAKVHDPNRVPEADHSTSGITSAPFGTPETLLYHLLARHFGGR